MPVLSVFTKDSAQVIEAIFKMHFPTAENVVDLTWGKGRFWKWDYPFLAVGVDIDPAMKPPVCRDGRNTGFPPNSFDVAVIDPPFMHGSKRSGESTRSDYKSSVGMLGDYAGIKNQMELLKLYIGLCVEAKRLSKSGVIVKCKDIIECRKYTDNTRRVGTVLERLGFTLIDKAVLVPTQVLPDDPKWNGQQHFRRQESYFLVGKTRAR